MTILISHAALEHLELTSAWAESNLPKGEAFRAEKIYGQTGKLNWLWEQRWDDPQAMREDLCQNMGGGVPIEVIDALVTICTQLAS